MYDQIIIFDYRLARFFICCKEVNLSESNYIFEKFIAQKYLTKWIGLDWGMAELGKLILVQLS